MSGVYKKEKERLHGLISDLDVKAEANPLNTEEHAAKRDADGQLAKLLCEEEVKWFHRAKISHVQEGDNNT